MNPADVPAAWVQQVAAELLRRMEGGGTGAGPSIAPAGSLAGTTRGSGTVGGGYGAPAGSGGANVGGGYGGATPSAGEGAAASPGGYDGGYGSAPSGGGTGGAPPSGYGSPASPTGFCGCGGGSASAVACGTASGSAIAGCRIPGFEHGHDVDRMTLLREHGVARIGCLPGVGQVDAALAAMIDHTLLRPEATDREIVRLCEEAHCHGFATVCVQPIWVPLAARVLEQSRVRVCTVVGFPHGANRAEVKAYETQLAVAQGAREVDMVIPIGALKSGDLRTVSAHVRAVVRAAIPGVVTKVILETAYLTDEEKRAASRIVRDEGAHFVKTSTGFASAGATLDDVRLMREAVGPSLGVKAAGGIRDRSLAEKMVAAGATRIGASASIQIAGAVRS